MQSHPRSADDPDQRLSLRVRDHLTLSCYWFSLNFQNAALFPIVIPLQIAIFIAPGTTGNAQQAIFLAWLGVFGACSALIVQPIAGSLSDHTPGRFGRRRPYILAGSVTMLAGIAMVGFAREAGAFLIGFMIMQLGANVVNATYQSLIPDLVPHRQRGAASGYMGLMTILGNVGSLAIAGLLLSQVGNHTPPDAIMNGVDIFYLLSGIMLAAGLIVTACFVHETSLRRRPVREQLDLRHVVHHWLGPWQHHNFAWVFCTRAAVMLGLTLFMTYIEYYFATISPGQQFVMQTAIVALLALFGAVCSAFVLGVASDRWGRVTIVCFATACMAIPALAFVLSPGSVPLWPLGILFGVGYGAYTSVDWALAIDALPAAETVGRDMGLWSLASNLPALLAPLLGGIVITLGNSAGQIELGYRAVFALAAVFLALGAVFVLGVHEERHHGEHHQPVEVSG
jgi:MFS family permease